MAGWTCPDGKVNIWSGDLKATDSIHAQEAKFTGDVTISGNKPFLIWEDDMTINDTFGIKWSSPGASDDYLKIEGVSKEAHHVDMVFSFWVNNVLTEVMRFDASQNVIVPGRPIKSTNYIYTTSYIYALNYLRSDNTTALRIADNSYPFVLASDTDTGMFFNTTDNALEIRVGGVAVHQFFVTGAKLVKFAGTLQFGTYTLEEVPQGGTIVIKDAGGTTRKLLCA